MPHQCKHVMEVLALIISLLIGNVALNGPEIKWRSIAISTELWVLYAVHELAISDLYCSTVQPQSRPGGCKIQLSGGAAPQPP